MNNMITLSKESPVPLYVQLEELIENQILTGSVKSNGSLPSERQLCEIYGVSHITVRLALAELSKNGFLVRVPGKGTFVADRVSYQTTADVSLGLVIPESPDNASSPFTSEIILGIKKITNEKNYRLLIYTGKEKSYHNLLTNQSVKGLILTDPQIKDLRIRELRQKRFPLVVIGRPDYQTLYCVDSDNPWIGYCLTEHLIKSGYQRIGFINGPAGYTVSQDRLAGYRKALRKYGFAVKKELIIFGSLSSEKHGFRSVKELISKKADAIVCADDRIAVGALSCIKKAGLKIPEEIGLAGCNNSLFTRYTHPTITTVEIFAEKLGAEAAKKLVALIEKKRPAVKTKIKGKLIVRESSVPENRNSMKITGSSSRSF